MGLSAHRRVLRLVMRRWVRLAKVVITTTTALLRKKKSEGDWTVAAVTSREIRHLERLIAFSLSFIKTCELLGRVLLETCYSNME